MTKPFGIDELLARMRAVLRRERPDQDEPIVELGAATVDLSARRVTAATGRPARGPADADRMAPAGGADPPSRQAHVAGQLLREVWGPGYENAQGNLRFYMGQLRRKLEADPARPRHLLTEPGMGYRFQPLP